MALKLHVFLTFNLQMSAIYAKVSTISFKVRFHNYLKSALDRNCKLRLDDVIHVTFEVLSDYTKKSCNREINLQNVRKSIAVINFNELHQKMLGEEEMARKYDIVRKSETEFQLTNKIEEKTYVVEVIRDCDTPCRASTCKGHYCSFQDILSKV